MSNKKNERNLKKFDEAREVLIKKIEQLPEKAEPFKKSLKVTLDNICDWVSSNNYVTDKQIKAVKNMIKGVEKWLK